MKAIALGTNTSTPSIQITSPSKSGDASLNKL